MYEFCNFSCAQLLNICTKCQVKIRATDEKEMSARSIHKMAMTCRWNPGGKVKVPFHLGYHSSLQSTKGNAKVCKTEIKCTQVAKST